MHAEGTGKCRSGEGHVTLPSQLAVLHDSYLIPQCSSTVIMCDILACDYDLFRCGNNMPLFEMILKKKKKNSCGQDT